MNRHLRSALTVAATAASAAALETSARTALMWGVMAWWAMTAPWAAASDVTASGCTMAPVLIHPLTERDGGLGRYLGMPEHCLKTMYLNCSAASERVVLGQGAMMACSLGHEALLKGVFGGDLDALLAWWRSHRASAPGN